jgi:Spy/CpxP family protein refolding chaperone
MRLPSMMIMLSAATVAAGLVLAQAPAPGARPPAGKRFGPGPDGFGGGLLSGPNAERRLTQRLGLNAAQQNTLHTALQEQQVQVKGLSDRMAELRTQLAAAVRAGDEGKIDQVTRDMAQINQQRAAISAKTIAKVYGSLNADQKAQVDRTLNRELGIRDRLRRGTPGQPPPVQQ